MIESCYTPLALAQSLLDSPALSIECFQLLQTPQQAPSAVPILNYLGVFGLTCLLESPFYLLAFRGLGLKPLRKIAGIVLPNLATHPIVYFAIPAAVAAAGGRYQQTLTIGELFAPLLEMFLIIWIWRVPKPRAVLLMIAANLFSWWAGIYLVSI